jgi:excisionase family DNA binding protein
MTDSADELAAAIRRVINDAVHAALRAQPPPERLPPPEPPKSVEEWPPERMLYPLKEIQQMLCISRTTVYQLLGDGQLPSVKIGCRRFVTAAALDAYVEGLT